MYVYIPYMCRIYPAQMMRREAEGLKGHFRASFEDRILMSDLVVCKCWITVPFREPRGLEF